MAHVENVWVYPVKGFDAMEVETARISDAGTLEGDREYALVDPAAGDVVDDRFDTVGETFNGKEIDTTHEVTSAFDPETRVLSLTRSTTGERRRFDLAADRAEAGEWFSEFVGEPVELRRRGPPSFVDRPGLGPSVISTGTLEAVASWFDEMTVEGARARLRPNVEIGGVPAFWEDRFLGDDPSGFTVDGTRLEGAEACARCVVPSRDPETGEPIDRFRQRFAERREETLPEWADRDAFDHFFTVMLITAVPEGHYGETISVGDDVSA